jgi:hypothetical protein
MVVGDDVFGSVQDLGQNFGQITSTLCKTIYHEFTICRGFAGGCYTQTLYSACCLFSRWFHVYAVTNFTAQANRVHASKVFGAYSAYSCALHLACMLKRGAG